MTIQQAREVYKNFSDKASVRVKELAYGALAIIWLLDGSKGLLSSINSLGLPLGLAVAVLALDLMQYLYGAAVWGVWGRWKERESKGAGEEEGFAVPAIMNWPTIFFFWGKALLIISAYVAIFIIIARKLM